MTVRLGPVPGFPRWTGVRAILSSSSVRDGALVARVKVRLTWRAWAWTYWRTVRGKGVDGAAP
ncbi:hypothetical protein [Streptomyces sp. NBRC 110035]|uniref:hypothetical protein n=1 Tax=Streptomyces sp. NBRC 110035 TaxID=1547867 RepID=UPI0005A71FCF|nr:hypothetical protein [Streptomyces sp. NBRC 110035]